MPQGFYGQFLGTLGVEMESIGLTRETVLGDILPKLSQLIPADYRNINVTRDASTEFLADYVTVGSRHLLVSKHTSSAKRLRGFRGNNITMGYEIFTNPMTIPQMSRVIYPLTFALKSRGDFISNRAATHFHVGFANNLRLLKNMLRICLMLDPVLFRLGGMGRKFRGFSNLAAYARPLMNSAAVPVSPIRRRRSATSIEELREEARRIESGELNPNEEREQEISPERVRYVSVINPLKALEATSIEEFWACFSVNYAAGATKYHPARYSGTNFIAVPHHGTIEFRHFNQTHEPQLIMAIGKFLRGIVEMSTLLNKGEAGQFEIISPNSQISVSDGVDIMNRLLALCNEKEVEDLPDDYDMEILFDTLEKSSFEALPEFPVKTHYRDFYVDPDMVDLGGLIPWKKVLEPKHVDIHNINVQSLFD